MRIWSLHPSHLDAKGLVALWRETLLAQHVLLGKTKGYTQHPQLLRFKEHTLPVGAIGAYLLHVEKEASARGYNFDASKIIERKKVRLIEVSEGQVEYEWEHLLRKLKERDPERYKASKKLTPTLHPLFSLCKGPVADWERV